MPPVQLGEAPAKSKGQLMISKLAGRTHPGSDQRENPCRSDEHYGAPGYGSVKYNNQCQPDHKDACAQNALCPTKDRPADTLKEGCENLSSTGYPLLKYTLSAQLFKYHILLFSNYKSLQV